MNTRKIHFIGTYSDMAVEFAPEHIPDLTARISRRLYTLAKTFKSWIRRAILSPDAATLKLYDQCDAMDMALVYASLDYDRRQPAQEIKMTQHKLNLLRREGGL